MLPHPPVVTLLDNSSRRPQTVIPNVQLMHEPFQAATAVGKRNRARAPTEHGVLHGYRNETRARMCPELHRGLLEVYKVIIHKCPEVAVDRPQ